MIISAMRRKSRRFASDIFASPNGWQLARLLGARRERPSCRRAAEQCDERATAAHSITSVARSRRIPEMVTGTTLAVLG
jgi:hypothetical protein